MYSMRRVGGLRACRSLRVRLASLVGIVVLTGAGCSGEDIIEPPGVGATVYGTATVAGQAVSGRTVIALGFAPQCQQTVAVVGSGVTDASGKYRIVLGGSTAAGPICVRVGFPSGSGTDTLFAVDTVDVRTTLPYDSVRIDFNRATP